MFINHSSTSDEEDTDDESSDNIQEKYEEYQTMQRQNNGIIVVNVNYRTLDCESLTLQIVLLCIDVK